MLAPLLAGLLALTPALIPVHEAAAVARIEAPPQGTIATWRVSLAFDGRRLDDVYDLSRLPALPAPVREVRAGPDGIADFSASRATGIRADTVLALATLDRVETGAVTVEIETGTRAQIFLNDRLVRRAARAGRLTLDMDLLAGRNTVAIALSGPPGDRLAGLRIVTEDLPGW